MTWLHYTYYFQYSFTSLCVNCRISYYGSPHNLSPSYFPLLIKPWHEVMLLIPFELPQIGGNCFPWACGNGVALALALASLGPLDSDMELGTVAANFMLHVLYLGNGKTRSGCWVHCAQIGSPRLHMQLETRTPRCN